MSTPVLNPTTQELGPVRLYTEMDPYIYSVDNRPLQDLADNTEVLATAVDSARTNQLTSDICDSALDAGIVGFNTHLLGLNATNPSVGVLSLSPGVLMVKAPINAGDSREVLKRASAPMTSLVNVPHPSTLGKEVKYLIQVRYRDFDTSTSFPGYQQDNLFSASGISKGWMEIGVVVGVQADIGESVSPTPTSGWLPVYEVLARSGDTTVSISPASSAVDRTSKVIPDPEVSIEAFDSDKSLNGYQRIPSGFIIQWGTQSVAPEGSTVTFPIAFPTGALSLTATAVNTGEEIVAVSAGALSTASVPLRHNSASPQNIRWMALGH